MPEHAIPAPPRRRGRPRGGGTETRERIIDAAVAEFEEQGYDAATIRSIAARAGVDAALVHHYFGTKADLFTGVIGTPMQPVRQIAEILDAGPDDVGERLARFVIETWDRPEFRRRGVAVLRAAIGKPKTTSLLVGFVSREILARLAAVPGMGTDAELRASLVASQVVGLILARYVLQLAPLATASVDEAVAAVGPTLQRYLTGPIDGARETIE